MNANFSWWAVQTPKFLVNWAAADEAYLLSHGEDLLTRKGKGIADLQALNTALQNAINAVEAKVLDASLARGAREAGKKGTRTGFEEWQRAVNYNLSDTPLGQQRPTLPALDDGEKVFTDKLLFALNLWDDINKASGIPNFTPPLITRSGLTRAAFATQVAALQTAYADTPRLEEQAALLRTTRDQIAGAIHDLCIDYIAAVENAFAPTDPVRLNLPDLSPRSSRTPGAVALSGSFDPTTGTAPLSWTASDDPDLARYSVRISAGPRYKGDDEATIGDITPPATSFSVPAIYLPTGATVWAKVFVILSSGHEKGSDAVKVSAS
jgi:hypothetical protein